MIKSWAVAAVVAIGGAVVAVPSEAVAATTGPDRQMRTSALTTAAAKTVTVTCPEGTSVFGAGGILNPTDGGIALTGIVPDDTLESVSVTAVAVREQQAAWSVTAVAVCQAPAGLQPERVSDTALGGTATATCPAGKALYGVGYAQLGVPGEKLVDRVEPDAYLSHVDVHARGATLLFSPTVAYALCALPWQPQGERTQVVTANDATSPKRATAPKPMLTIDYGTWVYAAGAKVTGAGDLHIDALIPTIGLDGGFARAARMPSALTKTRAGRAATLGGDDYELTVYADSIGSWY